ncbi:Dirigent protein 19 [Linum perenne]
MATKTVHVILLTLLLTISLSHSTKLTREKLTHLKFYFHDIVSGPNPTALPVVRSESTNASSSAFGLVVMMDNPLTVGPNMTSKLVGRAQGIYASASQTELSFLMVFNFAFKEGKYNGSNLSVLGRNSPFSGVIREMPVVGGSGVFRFARGYAQARTHRVDLNTGPNLTSKLVGRAQGIYASASQSELSFLMVLNFAFKEGKYNGSNLSVLGRNNPFSGVREMPVVGGSGVFRFARGYAQARTHWIDLKSGDAVVEYNVYVFHY